MLFNSFSFLIFFVVVTGLWLLLKAKYRWILLLAASCFFYAFLIPAYLLVLGAVIAIDFFTAIRIEKSRGPLRRWFLLLSIAANLAILFGFKYHDFFADTINLFNGAAGRNREIQLWHWLLPVGLSFHTFQAMAYTVDVYRGSQKAERHFGFYALFVMFYPQLVAGPIERAGHLLPQLKEQKPVNYSDLGTGLKWMLWGYFLKVVLADRLGIYVDYIFLHVESHGRLALTIAAFFYSFQIYGDFAGYSLIALGTARCMGIRLTANFNRPYLSGSLREFWHRWNITLSMWFRDYLYLPLGGSRVTRLRFIFNILVVFVLSGLWHGANGTFIIWGLIHGCLLLLNRLFAFWLKGRTLPRWIIVPLTFFCVTISWIFFRSASTGEALLYLRRLFSPGTESAMGGEFDERVLLIYGFLAIAAVMASEYYTEYSGKKLLMWDGRSWLRLTACVALIVMILLFGIFDAGQFIYFQF